MFTEEKQNFPTSQDFDSIEYPQSEKEVSNLIKKFYKSNIPLELIGSGSKRKIGKSLQCSKTLSLSKLNGIIEYLPKRKQAMFTAIDQPIAKKEIRTSRAQLVAIARTMVADGQFSMDDIFGQEELE